MVQLGGGGPARIRGRWLLAHEIALVTEPPAASPGVWRIIDDPRAEPKIDRAGAGHCPS